MQPNDAPLTRRAVLGGAALLLPTAVAAQPSSPRRAEPVASRRVTAPGGADVDRTFSHHRVTANGIRLHYVEGGSGERGTVVLLHGFPQTWYAWRKVMPALAKAGYRVVVPDLRGCGDSEITRGGYDKKTIAADIRDLVRQLGHEKVLLVGHDWGACVAYAYASLYPGNVAKLAILDVLMPGLGLEALMDGAKGHWHIAFHRVPDLPEMLVEGRERLYVGYWLRMVAADKAAVTDEMLDLYGAAYAKPGAMRAGFEYYRAITQDEPDFRGFAKTKLTMPVLALGGETTMGEGAVAHMRELAVTVTGGAVAGSGHLIPEERPAELTRRLLTFFAAA
jgi:pimeloyl-ACP methyl ester carboxylesterase